MFIPNGIFILRIYGPKGPFLVLIKNNMPITLDKKKSLVSGLENSLKGAKSVVFVKFDKLTVADVNSLRRGLQKESVGYVVAKKTLLKRALGVGGITGELPEMPGQVAIAYGEDLLAPAREVLAFQKTHKDNISIIGGVFEGKYMNQEEMMSIATIPPLQTLRAMFVNIINSPIQRFAVALDQIAAAK
jgi:large subunit ribosomal protein L10